MARRRFGVLLGVLLAVGVSTGAALSWHQATTVLGEARGPTPALFDHGLTALDPQAPSGWTNEWCGSCHQAAFEQWSRSMHAQAGSNTNFGKQFSDPDAGRQQWCINCHAPINPGELNHASREPEGIDQALAQKHEWLTRGVDCITCHVRDGLVLATQLTEKAEQAHPMRLAPELASPEFCAGCHQFGHKRRELPDGWRGLLQQASLEEFLDYRKSGGTESRCHECHMPGGDHEMPGGYSVDMVQRALELDLTSAWHEDSRHVEVTVAIRADSVGHRVPGGEHHFRFLTLQTTITDAAGDPLTPAAGDRSGSPPAGATILRKWPQVESMRYKMGPSEQGHAPLEPGFPDTRLFPGERREFRYAVPVDPGAWKGPLRVRAEIRYHVLNDEEAAHFGLAPQEIQWEVLSEEQELVLAAPPSEPQAD